MNRVVVKSAANVAQLAHALVGGLCSVGSPPHDTPQPRPADEQELVPHVPVPPGDRIGLVVVDSVAAVFRGDFGAGRADLIERKDWFFHLGALMKRLSVWHNITFVVVNQMTSAMSEDGAAGSGGGALPDRKPALGMSWASCVNTRCVVVRCGCCVSWLVGLDKLGMS